MRYVNVLSAESRRLLRATCLVAVPSAQLLSWKHEALLNDFAFSSAYFYEK